MISDRPGADTVLGGRLTPETVRRIDFPRTPLGRRGYHETDVERFRNRVVLEIVTANAEKAELRQEIQRLRDYYRRQGIAQQITQSSQSSLSGGQGGNTQQSGQAGVSPQGGAGRRGARAAAANEPETAGARGSAPSTGQLSVDAVNVMSRAQQAADQHIAQAEEYARRLIATSRAQYEEILVHAHEQAEKASAEAALIIERQHELALQASSVREAASSSDAPTPELRVDADASRTDPSHTDPSYIDPDQATHLLQLESRLTYMRTFAQVTQVQLRSILDALGEELEHLSVPVPNA